MKHQYIPTGTCSRRIDIELTDGVITSLAFEGGCNGNLQGICALARGLRPEQVIDRLAGLTCGSKNTSCPDQLARALRQAAEAESGQ